MKKERSAAKREFDLAWEEYFKDKPNPKSDEEEKIELEEFHYWYNHVRKQTDTEKTPAEMYKEIYGEEPPEEIIKDSRMMNLGWDEEDSEEINEAIEVANEIFDERIWKSAKIEIKDLSKRELAKSMFSLGFTAYYQMMNEKTKDIENNPKIKKKIGEMIKELEREEKQV